MRAILHAHTATGSGEPLLSSHAAPAAARAAVIGGVGKGSAGKIAPKPEGILAVPEERNREELQARDAGRVLGVQSAADRRPSTPKTVGAAEEAVAGETGIEAASRFAPRPFEDAAKPSEGVAGKPGGIPAKEGAQITHVSVDCLGLPQHSEACSSSLGSQRNGGGKVKEPPPQSKQNGLPRMYGVHGWGGSNSEQKQHKDGGLRERLAARESMNTTASEAGSICNAVNDDAAGLNLKPRNVRQAGLSMGPAADKSSEELQPMQTSNARSSPQGARAVLPVLPILPTREKLAKPPERASQPHRQRPSVQSSAVPNQAARKHTGTEQIHCPRRVENAKDHSRGLVPGRDGHALECSDGLIGWRRAKHCDTTESGLVCVNGPPAEISRCNLTSCPSISAEATVSLHAVMDMLACSMKLTVTLQAYDDCKQKIISTLVHGGVSCLVCTFTRPCGSLHRWIIQQKNHLTIHYWPLMNATLCCHQGRSGGARYWKEHQGSTEAGKSCRHARRLVGTKRAELHVVRRNGQVYLPQAMP